MELLQLILFGICYSFMNTLVLFDTIFIFIFLKINYKTQIIDYNPYNNISVLINFINIIIYLTIYYINIIFYVVKQNNFGNMIICTYNHINSKYIKIKNKILYYTLVTPVIFIIKKIFNNLVKKFEINKNLIDKQNMYNLNYTHKLQTNQDINNFLDRLID
jgi:hypothetical protein